LGHRRPKELNSKGLRDPRTSPAVRGNGRDTYTRQRKNFRKNPNPLARYIREGTPWLEDEGSGSPKPEDVKNFYTALWVTKPSITIPFTVIGSGLKAQNVGEVFQAITALDINQRLNHIRQNTASEPKSIQRKHVT
jgi:hypothetical protein